MKHKAIRPIEQVVSITCDKCNKTSHDDQYDFTDFCEYLSYEDTAGFTNGSFEDGTRWSIDLCPECTKELLGKYIKYYN